MKTLLCYFVAVSLISANIAGNWQCKITTIDGTKNTFLFRFRTEKNKLSGNVYTRDGMLPLRDCKLKGDSIHFRMEYNGYTINNSGRCYADSISLRSTWMEEPYHVVLKRFPHKITRKLILKMFP